MRFLVLIVSLFVGLFASADQTAHAQIYQPQPPAQSQLVPVTGPNCPSIQLAGGGTLQTAPWPYLNSSCVHYGTRANVTIPQGMAFEWRYYVQGPWWWPFPLEQTAIAYAGQSVSSDFLRLYYAPYVAYMPGQPIYQPPVTVPPTQPSPMPGLPAPGTPAPSQRIESGVGITIIFGQGWRVAGYQLQYASGRVVWQCHTFSTPEAGQMTTGVINPHAGDIALAPNPCP